MSEVTIVVEKEEFKICVKGSFDYGMVDEFRESYVDVMDRNMNVTLDLSQTEYIDSSALGMVLNMKNYLKKEDRAIQIKNCKPNLMKLFTMAHFERKFKFI